MLGQCDMRMGTDMPTDILDAWKEYRVKLRDFPATLLANNVEPTIAYYIFPESPDDIKAKKSVNGGAVI